MFDVVAQDRLAIAHRPAVRHHPDTKANSPETWTKLVHCAPDTSFEPDILNVFVAGSNVMH